jgi:ABC-2 type transport system ATP-binding protein
MRKVISLKHVSKFYGQFQALKEISFDVYEGEVFGFIGKNGAGKTTTINLMLSLLNKDDGVISFFDEPISMSNIAYKRNIGYVPDVPMFPPYYTAYEYLKYTKDIFSVDKRKGELEEILAFVGLDLSKKRIGQFSRGMKQRLAIAQAMVHNPKILIMDEPTSALDPTGRKEVLDIINRLKGKTTVFYSTHILADAERVCDRIGLIDQGEIKLVKSMKEIIETRVQSIIQVEYQVEVNHELIHLPKTIRYLRFEDNKYVYEINKITLNQAVDILMKQGLEIQSFALMRPSLEDVFMEVTS